jgi:hypothetical protein
MSSLLIYNNISLPFVKTEVFNQETVYSPDGVDSIYTKITIGVGCVLSPCLFNNMDVATWVSQVKPYLMVKGGQLSYMVDGCYILQPTISDSHIQINCNTTTTGSAVILSPGDGVINMPADAKLGPFPQRFDVRRIEGNTWLAYYEIVTYLPYCTSTPTYAPYYLSNRWSTNVNIDEDYFLTRIIDGTLILNGQYSNQTTHYSATQEFPVDFLVKDVYANSVIIPPCPNRWKREAIDIQRSSDGLTINYKITDKQLYTAIPRPATRIDAQYSETSGTKDFALMNMMICEIQVTVYGEPNASWNPTGTIDGNGVVTWTDTVRKGLDYNKYALMTLMFQVVLSRIPFPFLLKNASEAEIGSIANPDSNKYIIQYFQMKEDVFKPIVGCTVRAMRPRLFNAQDVGNTLTTTQGIYAHTNIGSTILLTDCIADIARQPENMLNWGQFLIAAKSLDLGTIGDSITKLPPCELASAILYPCKENSFRYIGTSLASSDTTLGSTNITVKTMDYSAIGANIVNPVNEANKIESSGRMYSKEQYRNPFTEYTIDVQYLTNHGYLQLPIMYDAYAIGTTPASGCVIAQTSAGYTKKIVHFKASRIGKPPVIPRPDDIEHGYGQYSYFTTHATGNAAGSDKLLDYHLTFSDSFLLQDGISRKYEIGGVYECAMRTRLTWDASGYHLPVCVNPITSDVWETTVGTGAFTTSIATGSCFPNSLFASGIIGYSDASPAGGNPST